jgi:multiple sugar transport system substrate-binding protein
MTRDKLFSLLCGQILILLLVAANPVFASDFVRVLSFKDGHALAVQEQLPQFEKETGIRVVMDLIPAANVAAKIVADQAGGGVYDAYLVDEPYLPDLAPFLVPVNAWPVPVSEQTGSDQFVAAAVTGSSFEGKQFGLPVNGNVYMYIYRKDLFEDPAEKAAYRKRFGTELQPPKSPSEFEQIAAFFYRPPHLFGFAPFTKMSEGATVEAIWAIGLMGLRLFNEKGQLQLSASQLAEAFGTYRRLMQYAPPGAGSWHHAERMRAYSKGTVAQMMTWPSFLKDLEDTSKSLVVGKTAYARAPSAVPNLSSGVAGTWSIALSKKGRDLASAARFAQWWAGRESGRSLVGQGMNPARRDLLSDTRLVTENPWFPSILENFEAAQVRPRVRGYKEVSHVISRIFTEVVSGRTSVESASDQLVKELDSAARQTR